MGDKIDILKIILDFFKGNKLLFLYATAVLGIGGNIYQAIPKVSTVKIPEVIQKTKVITIKTDNSECLEKITELKLKINKLERWH